MGKCSVFFQIYTNYIKKNKDNILNYIQNLKKKNKETKEITARIYNMSCVIDYTNLYIEFEKIFTEI